MYHKRQKSPTAETVGDSQLDIKVYPNVLPFVFAAFIAQAVQIRFWVLMKLDKISETPVFSRLLTFAPIITEESTRRTMPVAFIYLSPFPVGNAFMHSTERINPFPTIILQITLLVSVNKAEIYSVTTWCRTFISAIHQTNAGSRGRFFLSVFSAPGYRGDMPVPQAPYPQSPQECQ